MSVESPAEAGDDSFLLLDAHFVAAVWADTSPAGVMPQHRAKAKSVSVVLLLLGVPLLWLVPLGGALLLATASLGLTIAWEVRPGGPLAAPSITTITASQPLTSPSTGH